METYLMKFGGNAIRGQEDMMRLSREIATIVSQGYSVVLVHGGGPEISEEMEKRGLSPKKVAGFRVTDDAALEVAEIVLKRINDQVVSCLKECGVTALGSPGYMFALCEKKPPVTVNENGTETTVDLGLVGVVKDVNTEALNDVLAAGVVPVIYPIGKDVSGKLLNVNADTMAAGMAAGIDCKEMITITDVPGILMDVSDPSSKIDTVRVSELDGLISKGVISGGMIPKVEACRDALNAGVAAVRMVNGKDKDCIVSDIIKDISRGTLIIR